MTATPCYGYELNAGDLILADIPEGTVEAFLTTLEVLPSAHGDARTGTWVSSDGLYCGRIDLLGDDIALRVSTRDERAEASRKAARDAQARWAA